MCIFAAQSISYLGKIITYIALILVLVSYNYKTIVHFVQLTARAVMVADEYDCEEKSSESKTTEEKKEKNDFSDYTYLVRSQALSATLHLSTIPHESLLYAGKDYSLGVYSPPDYTTV